MDALCTEVELGLTTSVYEYTEEVVYNGNATTRISRNADDFRLSKYKKNINTKHHVVRGYEGLKLFNVLEPQRLSKRKY
jgi:hypothetical protein